MPVSYELVENGLEHIWDFAYLRSHPLARSSFVDKLLSQSSEAIPSDHGIRLNKCLQQAIQLLALDGRPRRISRERRYHDILYYCYVEGERNDKVAHKLDISQRTLYRERRKAIEAIAGILNSLNCD